jgi:putative glutamine amidotransferase
MNKKNVIKPIIGILLRQNLTSSTLINIPRSVDFISDNYFKWILEMGGIPYFITPLIDKKDLKLIFKQLDGILFIGGPDLDPKTYNEKPKISYQLQKDIIGNKYHRHLCLAPNIKIDLIELHMYQLAKKMGLPILGICRGLQLINVAEGGKLYQEIDEISVNHFISNNQITNYHSIKINNNSRCFQIMGVDNYFTSSIHHQAISKLGSDLIASATAEDGSIEIVEHKNPKKFIFGIQGHPELTRKNLSKFDNIFLKFVECAKNIKNKI